MHAIGSSKDLTWVRSKCSGKSKKKLYIGRFYETEAAFLHWTIFPWTSTFLHMQLLMPDIHPNYNYIVVSLKVFGLPVVELPTKNGPNGLWSQSAWKQVKGKHPSCVVVEGGTKPSWRERKCEWTQLIVMHKKECTNPLWFLFARLMCCRTHQVIQLLLVKGNLWGPCHVSQNQVQRIHRYETWHHIYKSNDAAVALIWSRYYEYWPNFI